MCTGGVRPKLADGHPFHNPGPLAPNRSPLPASLRLVALLCQPDRP